ncbi:MAG: carbon-nitrogen hydrolase family protein [Ruminococcaceae bacterium]|nr:carbon-nitrogen hydrolase family protein [Oscillospiraceae bacterium]
MPNYIIYNLKNKEQDMLNITVVQPRYFSGNNPDEKIAEFLINQLESVSEGGLIVLPEYSNAGGLSDIDSELAALPRAEIMLKKASEISKNKGSYVSINVLQKRTDEIKNSTYLFDKNGEVAFIYDKQHLPPSEIKLGVKAGNDSGKCQCLCELDGIKFGFMTCYDVYFNEQIEHIAKGQPDIILIPGYQRGERIDIIHAQAKLTAFRCNAYVARSSYSMDSDEYGGCSMIVAPDGKILKNMGKEIGSISVNINPFEKYMRSAGYGENKVRNDEFISAGLCPQAFE